MKKSIKETLNAFAADPIGTENLYREKSRRWYLEETKMFWRGAMATHPDNTLKETAERLIKFLHESDLIRYDHILSDYFTSYEDCNYDCDTGLRTYTIDYIADNYDWWLEDAEGDGADELRAAVADAEQVWYWPQLMTYCVGRVDWEYGFIEKVVNEANY